MNSGNKDRKEKDRKEETIHFELFKTCCKDLPQSKHTEHPDNPDFLIYHNAGVLGIEHTQLFKETKHPSKGYSPQAVESFMQQIVDSARKECEKDIPPLDVKVFFNSHQEVPKNRTQEIKKISHSLAEIVKKWYHENPLKSDEILNPTLEISTIVSAISITRSPYYHHHWTFEEVAFPQNLPVEIIQRRIDKKNALYKEYLKKCDECWLLIVVNVFRDSQSFEIPDRIDHKFESKFERVYYIDASHRKDLWELPIIRI